MQLIVVQNVCEEARDANTETEIGRRPEDRKAKGQVQAVCRWSQALAEQGEAGSAVVWRAGASEIPGRAASFGAVPEAQSVSHEF